MRGPHPQSHVTLWYRGHGANNKRYISTFTRPVDPKLSRVFTQHEWFQKCHVTFQFCSHMTIWICHISSTTGLWPLNLAGCVLRLRGRLAQSQMTLLFRGHVTKTSFSLLFSLSHCLWSVGLAKDERTSLKKFTIHVTLPPLDKLKTLCLIFLSTK